MTSITYSVSAYIPMLNKASSRFLRSLDLGIDKGYIFKTDILLITFKDGAQIDVARTAANIKTAYEQIGAINVTVAEVKK